MMRGSRFYSAAPEKTEDRCVEAATDTSFSARGLLARCGTDSAIAAWTFAGEEKQVAVVERLCQL